MGCKMEAREAAQKLDQHLRQYTWYTSTGIGVGDDLATVLFVYVRSARHKELSALTRCGWLGYRVEIKPIGAVRPTSFSHCPETLSA